jgi:hypothetical protein
VFKPRPPAGGNLEPGADTPFVVEQTHQMSMIVSNVIVTNELESGSWRARGGQHGSAKEVAAVYASLPSQGFG